VWANRPDGPPDSTGWSQRSVPNLYPVLDSESAAPAPRTEQPAAESGLTSSIDPLGAGGRGAGMELFASQPAEGAHEVIVNTPEHLTTLGSLSPDTLAAAVAAWRERMRAHPDAAFVHVIVNEGPDAGASLEHTHAQLYALGFVPAAVARERERSRAYHERTMGSHLLGDVAVEEIRRRERLVAVDDESVLVCPWASRSPFELRVIPRQPRPRFEEDEGGAAMIGTALRALEGALGSMPQFNLWVRTAPSGAEEFCWHVDIVPRLTIMAGFELGTEVPINVYPPERAAADLRAAIS
jgi:UDPglucose--hexose-1-phosphate uridylyltransferase